MNSDFLSFLTFLNPLAPGSLVDRLAVATFYGAFIVALVYRVVTVRSIFIRRFRTPVGLEFDTRELAKRIRALVVEYEAVHTRGLLTVAGARSGLAKPRLAAEGVGVAAARWYLLENSGVSILYALLNWILPVKELVGDISVAENPRTIQARIETNGLLRKGVLAEGRAPLSGPGYEALDEAAVEVTYRLLLSSAEAMQVRRSESPGTDRWRALRALTEGLEVWSRTEDLPDELAAQVEARLDEALAWDHDYSLAHYNKGVFCYNEKSGATANKEARRHFLEARDTAARRLRKERGLVASAADTRLLGLASIGLARVYSQDMHRYGHLRFGGPEHRDAEPADAREPWRRAREAAAIAVQSLPGDPQAVYADAFAWHCTVSDGLTEDELTERTRDLDEGQKRYESLVRSWTLPWSRGRQRRFRIIHNNLGYVLMMRGEAWTNEARDARHRGSIHEAKKKQRKAESLWRRAERHMRIVIAVSPSQYNTKAYSWANLANLQRLRGRFSDAERSYGEAIAEWEKARLLQPSGSGPAVYVDGLAERARLWVEIGGRVEEALSDHLDALTAATSPGHRFKIARMFLIACERASLLGPREGRESTRESVESANEWLSESEGPSLEEWILRMREVLSPDSGEASLEPPARP